MPSSRQVSSSKHGQGEAAERSSNVQAQLKDGKSIRSVIDSLI